MERICIYPKDVQIITGRSERYGRNVLNQIKKKLAKEKHQLVSVEEFCLHTGLCISSVKQVLIN
jgi:hypothetical protein